MATTTDVTIGTGATSILTATESSTRPIYLRNESSELITLTIAGASDTYALDPTEYVMVLPGMVVTGTSVSGTAILQVLRGVVPDAAGAAGAAYDASSGSLQTWRTNPDYAWTQESTITDVTNATDGTAYYPSAGIDFDQYRYGGFQIALDCDAGAVTATVEASFQDDGTAGDSADYVDVTNDLFGVASLVASAGAASDLWVIDTPFPAKFLRIKIVYATGGNTGDATIYWRGTY
jgi:hypothetical protein